jgi:hypothetical protein
MHRTMLLQHLAQAEQHIALGRGHLAKQEALVARLDSHGRDTRDALLLLGTMRSNLIAP